MQLLSSMATSGRAVTSRFAKTALQVTLALVDVAVSAVAAVSQEASALVAALAVAEALEAVASGDVEDLAEAMVDLLVAVSTRMVLLTLQTPSPTSLHPVVSPAT